MPSATRRASGAAFKLRPGESITFVLPVFGWGLIVAVLLGALAKC